jgi:2-phosphosulfolactate phosphatase
MSPIINAVITKCNCFYEICNWKFEIHQRVCYFFHMHIDIQFVPFPPSPEILSNKTVVVIDVLRATSVIIEALSQGAIEVIPVTTVEEATRLFKTFPRGSTLLGGERGSRKIQGFDFGNSPKEYTAERVKGKRLVLTTTNGTKAFHSVAGAEDVLAGSFLNIRATAQRCLDLDRDTLLFPSGDEGDFSLEDVVCGGMLIDLITKKSDTRIDLTDASSSACILYQRFAGNLVEALHLSRHGKDLDALGLGEDLLYCAQTDITNLVPTFRDGVIRVF